MLLLSGGPVNPANSKTKSPDKEEPMSLERRGLTVKLPSAVLLWGLESVEEIIKSFPDDPFSRVIEKAIRQSDLVSYADFHWSPEQAARRAHFGDNISDRPRLAKHDAWKGEMPKGHETDEVHTRLLADVISRGTEILLASLHATEPTSNPALLATQILQNMKKPTKKLPASLINVSSPSLHTLHATPSEFSSEQAILRRSNLTANISPFLSFSDLHHDDGNGTQTLASGRKLWFFFPPTPSNLAVLHNVYTAATAAPTKKLSPDEARARRFCHALTGRDTASRKRKASPQRLTNGIMVLQTANTDIWVPPFRPHATFTLQYSVLVGLEYYLPRTLTTRIEHMDLFRVYEQCSRDAGKLQLAWVNELVDHIKTRFEAAKGGDAEVDVRGLFLSWEAQFRAGHLVKLVEQIEGMVDVKKTDFAELRAKVRACWKMFLRLVEVKAWNECPACGMKLNEEVKSAHLWEEHLVPCRRWPDWRL